MKDTVFYIKKTLNIQGRLMDLNTPKVMGIINLTPDSFYEGSRISGESNASRKAGKFLKEGADILDLGGYSSRPGADHISEEEEHSRVIPALKQILLDHPEAIVSVDTFRSNIAREALDNGAAMINDISAGTFDPAILPVVASFKVPYILMHMKGTPQTMIHENQYENLMNDLTGFFAFKVAALREMGIHEIILDPGFGFAKNIDQNYLLLKNLHLLKVLNLPILAGLSRKSMVYKKLHISPDEALNGSMVLQTVALMNGASIIRTHDVKEVKEAITLLSLLGEPDLVE